jgi:uncharacterized membrane protein YeaQ/YmgE (transglycosylase-associated protein family)
MSYLIVIVIGAVAALLASKTMKASEDGIGIDLLAGGLGAVVTVLIVRMIGPAGASGLVMSAVVAVIGAVGSLYAVRRFMKARLVPAPRARRRR